MSQQYLEELKVLMPPLEPPPDNNVDWEMAEQVCRIRFPEDFKQFISIYGNVIWCDLFRAIYPETDTWEKCEKSREEVLETLAIIFNDGFCNEDGTAITNLRPHPNPGGLLPCLTDTNSSFVCWLTSGKPEEWTLIKWHFGTVTFYDFTLTQLIRDWIKQVPPAKDAWGAFFLKPENYQSPRLCCSGIAEGIRNAVGAAQGRGCGYAWWQRAEGGKEVGFLLVFDVNSSLRVDFFQSYYRRLGVLGKTSAGGTSSQLLQRFSCFRRPGQFQSLHRTGLRNLNRRHPFL